MPAKSLMIGGTASHVGKSWMATAVCRWLVRQGIRAAPFKAQNMSNNSFACPDGGEIGRAQAGQAEACELAPSVHMNPILLKPTGEMVSQVVVQGKVWKNMSAQEYHSGRDFLADKVLESYNTLAEMYEFIVIEGAGSIAEVNLRETDLVNLGLAREIRSPVLLLADIDRGGVFGSVVGTLGVLSREDASLVRAFAINKFRGDPSLFAKGVEFLESRTNLPCIGVFPFSPEIHVDEEDSLSLPKATTAAEDAKVAILRFPRISNTTDFRLLDPAAWIEHPVERQFKIVILPGSKNTISDLHWLRAQGLESWLRRQHAGGATLVGICGGYQMLGARIEDRHRVESQLGSEFGLGLIPAVTQLRPEKTVVSVTACTPGGRNFAAYEIHNGHTAVHANVRPFAFVAGRPEGVLYNRCVGTYLHGALESPAVLDEMLGIHVLELAKERHYDRLAEWFDRTADPSLFRKMFL